MLEEASDIAKRAFDGIGKAYEDAFGVNSTEQVTATQFIISNVSRGGRVVDLGCGTGCPSLQLLTNPLHGLNVIGVDVSPVMTTLAKKNAPSAEIVTQPMYDFIGQAPPDSWDAAAAFFKLIIPKCNLPVPSDRNTI